MSHYQAYSAKENAAKLFLQVWSGWGGDRDGGGPGLDSKPTASSVLTNPAVNKSRSCHNSCWQKPVRVDRGSGYETAISQPRAPKNNNEYCNCVAQGLRNNVNSKILRSSQPGQAHASQAEQAGPDNQPRHPNQASQAKPAQPNPERVGFGFIGLRWLEDRQSLGRSGS